jgi:hypothetical protein
LKLFEEGFLTGFLKEVSDFKRAETFFILFFQKSSQKNKKPSTIVL